MPHDHVVISIHWSTVFIIISTEEIYFVCTDITEIGFRSYLKRRNWVTVATPPFDITWVKLVRNNTVYMRWKKYALIKTCLSAIRGAEHSSFGCMLRHTSPCIWRTCPNRCKCDWDVDWKFSGFVKSSVVDSGNGSATTFRIAIYVTVNDENRSRIIVAWESIWSIRFRWIKRL